MKPDVHHNIHVRRDIDANDDYARDYLDSDPVNQLFVLDLFLDRGEDAVYMYSEM